MEEARPMTAKPSQVERVRRALERAGPDGVSPVDFALPEVVDGGRPIMRLAARILDLRRQGLSINVSSDPNGTARYVLTSEPGPRGEPAPPPVEPRPVQESFFT